MQKQEIIFEPYDSIVSLNNQKCKKLLQKWNSAQFSLEQQIDKEEDKKCKWVMSEKIHGCNLSFIVNKNKEIKCAKRNATLVNDEKFYNFQQILNKIDKNLLNLFNKVSTIIPNLSQIQVYGELYGGKYRSLQLQQENQQNQQQNQDTQGIKVQHEVQYCPQNDFSAFDLKYYKNDQLNGTYLDFQTALKLFEEANINYIKPMKIGEFDELSQFDVEQFYSQIYKQYNLPEIEDNIAEGVVIRPYNRGHSPLIKKKSQRFFEKAKQPISERKQKYEEFKLQELVQKKEQQQKQEKNKKLAKELKKRHQEFCDEAVLYVCENRLKNMLSKTTEDQAFSNLHKFYLSFVDDAIEDFINDQEDQEREIWFKNLQGENKTNLNSILVSEAKAVVKEYRGPIEKPKKNKNKKK